MAGAVTDKQQSRFPTICLLLLLLCTASFAHAEQRLGAGDGINDHPHNLSSNSSAAIHSTTEDRICVFCHAPHGTSASGPLWNRQDPIGPNGDGTFPLYANAEPGLVASAAADYGSGTYPNGSTRLCLSCHDGVTAVGEVINGGVLDASLGNLTTSTIDLENAHPVSFIFSQAIANDIYGNRFNLTGMLDDLLDAEGRLQCSSCHDPHLDTENGSYDLPMWRHYTGNASTDYMDTCESCHKFAPGGIQH